MTKEKELGIFIAEMVNSLPDSGDNFKDCFTLAKAIIAKYPQITKKPDFIGQTMVITANGNKEYDTKIISSYIESTKVKVYVEVVS